MHKSQPELQEEHHQGLHFGQPHPHCWCCWDQEDEDGDNPEVPDPFFEDDPHNGEEPS